MDDLYGNSVPAAYFIIAGVLFLTFWALAVRWGEMWGLALGFLPAAGLALIIAWPLAFAWPLVVFVPVVLILGNIGKRAPGARWRSAEITGQRRATQHRA